MNRNLLRPVALFGTVAVIVTLTVALTLSRATLLATGVGSLKCYDVTGGVEKACSVVDRPALNVRTD
jgi:hypothetical protein